MERVRAQSRARHPTHQQWKRSSLEVAMVAAAMARVEEAATGEAGKRSGGFRARSCSHSTALSSTTASSSPPRKPRTATSTSSRSW
jgi:hypothetical protein